MKTKLFIGIFISLIFLVLAFRDVDFAGFWETLKNAQYRYFLLASALSVIVFVFRAYRWKFLLILQKDIPFLPVFSATSIGFFANAVLPFRAGELLRAYVIGRSEDISKSAALATILVERIIDVLSLLFVALSAIVLLPVPDTAHYETIKYFAFVLFIIELIVIIFCFIPVVKRDFAVKFTDKILRVLPEKIQKRAKNIINSFLDGLEIMKAAKHFVKLIVFSFAIWFFAFLQVISMLVAINVNMDLFTMVVASVVIMVLNRFALTIPSAPGSVGTFHAAAKEGLVIFAVDPNTAIGFSVLLHLSTYIPLTLTGFYFFMRENVKISAAQKVFRKEIV
ncbi:hypothetical protein AMJ80_06290 [bacterium SM23_31]|nr:MAG: hypothetical protein AMJ80_06290 [bacterium SM23_31]